MHFTTNTLAITKHLTFNLPNFGFQNSLLFSRCFDHFCSNDKKQHVVVDVY